MIKKHKKEIRIILAGKIKEKLMIEGLVIKKGGILEEFNETWTELGINIVPINKPQNIISNVYGMSSILLFCLNKDTPIKASPRLNISKRRDVLNRIKLTFPGKAIVIEKIKKLEYKRLPMIIKIPIKTILGLKKCFL